MKEGRKKDKGEERRKHENRMVVKVAKEVME